MPLHCIAISSVAIPSTAAAAPRWVRSHAIFGAAPVFQCSGMARHTRRRVLLLQGLPVICICTRRCKLGWVPTGSPSHAQLRIGVISRFSGVPNPDPAIVRRSSVLLVFRRMMWPRGVIMRLSPVLLPRRMARMLLVMHHRLALIRARGYWRLGARIVWVVLAVRQP